MKTEALLKKLDQIKYPLLVLAIGFLLILIPGRKRTQDETLSSEGGLSQLLSMADGVGEAEVLISEHGVLVICEGASDAAVKLDILRAVGSYTGFGSDKITILKLADLEKGGKGHD